MANVVIGGLIKSTLLSLLVVPVVFTDVDDLLQLGAAAPGGSPTPARHFRVFRRVLAPRGAAA